MKIKLEVIRAIEKIKATVTKIVPKSVYQTTLNKLKPVTEKFLSLVVTL